MNNIITEKIEVMREGKTKEEVYDDLKNLLIYLVSNHIYIEDRRYVSLSSENLIKEFSKKFIDESITKFNELFENYFEECSNELSDILHIFQYNFCISPIITLS